MRLHDLIEAIYDLVFEPGLMQAVLERMCALTDSESRRPWLPLGKGR